MIHPARPAVAGDRTDLARLAELAHDEAVAQRGGPMLAGAIGSPTDLVNGIDSLIADPDHRVVVATLETAIVGFAVAELSRADPPGAPVAVVRMLFTDPDVRRVGIGAELLTSIITWATGRGAVGVDSTVLPGNRSAKNFFEGFGLKARLITVHMPLDPHG